MRNLPRTKRPLEKQTADKSADPRIDALLRKIDDLESKLDSKLTKLDMIVKQLDDLRRYQRAPEKHREEGTDGSARPASLTRKHGRRRCRRHNATTADHEERLADFTQKLDDIYVQIEALRSNDLPELKKSLGQVRVKAAKPVTEALVVIENLVACRMT